MDNAPSELGGPADYFSYLLRLWREGGGDGEWRASLHDPRTGERVGFGSVEELFGYLQEQTNTPDGLGDRAKRGSRMET